MSPQKPPSLLRAVLLATACLAVLGAAAFWPSPRWVTPARPALKAPIVFDELENFRNPAAETSTSAKAQ
ncbi:MAG TPA: hypothetical protein VHP33_06390 [Polyangiaceae bacterium]|nr:hypothetical protein [Polyangiaceae bacterium]